MGIVTWFKSLFQHKRKKELPEVVTEIEEAYREVMKPLERLEVLDREIVPQKPQKAVHQDYGKFFKGKGRHQHKWYRRSVKAREQPEEN